MGYKRKLDDEMETRIITRYLKDKQVKVSVIARDEGVSRATVYDVLKRNGIAPGRM